MIFYHNTDDKIKYETCFRAEKRKIFDQNYYIILICEAVSVNENYTHSRRPGNLTKSHCHVQP